MLEWNTTGSRRKTLVFLCCVATVFFVLSIRLSYLMIFRADYYNEKADELHQRERAIKAARGEIYDRNGVLIAANKTVCTISVIHSQITDEEEVIRVLCKELDLSEETVRKRVTKVSARERIQSNVEKEVGDRIREYNLDLPEVIIRGLSAWKYSTRNI